MGVLRGAPERWGWDVPVETAETGNKRSTCPDLFGNENPLVNEHVILACRESSRELAVILAGRESW